MMTYMSLLVESKLFEEVEMNFLIVGHTHCSIDQFFSSLSTAINEASFIGSPLALINLFVEKRKRDPSLIQISVAKPIVVYYDFKKAIEPYINKKIKVSCNTLIPYKTSFINYYHQLDLELFNSSLL
jgi:hypothetical protein